MTILVLNAGSSSLKFALIDPHEQTPKRSGLAERLGTPEAIIRYMDRPAVPVPGGTIRAALEALPTLVGNDGRLTAIGHRVVHGGEQFTSAAVIDDSVIAAITDCVRLAPLHNPANLVGILTTRQLHPHLPQVAVFDTAFHQTIPESAWRYAVPDTWYREHRVRRYGFHGTSHQYVARRVADLIGTPLEALRLVTAHLGNGCSACAIRHGASVDTTMGLTPLEGLVMGTRSGDIDPGVMEYLAHSAGMDLATITAALNRKSGLLGLSGLSNDMRTLSEARASGHAGARLAIDVFCYRLAKSLAALMVPLGGADAVVFTGGIGEHSRLVRSLTLGHLSWLGLTCDESLNASVHEGPIDRDQRVWVIPTDEEMMIARETSRMVAASVTN